ncbi:MAG: hypothetical protein EON51_15345 [Acinetobacter sp.]|nr:MAG: hypothetical protein EON51_15345 [Acinetobacter sp.]
MVATIATCAIAYIALSSWKQQKKHELRIEIFANSRSAIGMIRSIRDPITFVGEITDDVISERQRVNVTPPSAEEHRYMIFLTRAKKTYDQYQKLLTLREKIWAEYDENHIFYRFYDYILQTTVDIRDAHHACMLLQDKKAYSRPEDAVERNRNEQKIAMKKGDEIEISMKQLFAELAEERKKKRRI